eukprot:431058-Rhodomonas_salina.1
MARGASTKPLAEGLTPATWGVLIFVLVVSLFFAGLYFFMQMQAKEHPGWFKQGKVKKSDRRKYGAATKLKH